MNRTHRDILGIDSAGQKDLWNRPNNSKAKGGNPTKTTGDKKGKIMPKSNSGKVTKSLNA